MSEKGEHEIIQLLWSISEKLNLIIKAIVDSHPDPE